MYAVADPPVNANPDDEEEEEEDEDEDGDSDSEAETGRNNRAIEATQSPQGTAAAPPAEPSELMQLEMSEDIRLGSPDDGSNNLDSDFHMLAVRQSANPMNHQRQADLYRAESTRRWPLMQEPLGSGIQHEQPSGTYIIIPLSRISKLQNCLICSYLLISRLTSILLKRKYYVQSNTIQL